MNIKMKKYMKLFQSTFAISSFTFGGGFVIVSLMRKKYVEQFGWLEESEMIDMASIAQSSPGAIAVNASILVGYRLLGVSGALVAILGTILPPLMIVSVIASFYNAFLGNLFFRYLLAGMKAGVAAVVLDAALSIGKSVLGDKNIFRILVCVLSFFAVYFLKINAAIVILASAAAGSLYGRMHKGDK